MTYRNRDLLRKPVALLRANPDEVADLDYLVDVYGGGSPSEIFRKVLLEQARLKRHERNSLAPNRLDRTAFGSLQPA